MSLVCMGALKREEVESEKWGEMRIILKKVSLQK